MVCKMHATTTESPRAARRSSRLSGVGPELTLSEAKERIDSLSKRKKRRRWDSACVETAFALVPLPGKRQNSGNEGQVAIEEKEKSLEPSRAPLVVEKAAAEGLEREEKPEPVKIVQPPKASTKKKPENSKKRVEVVSVPPTPPPPRGKCKSGRFWKSERDRFSSTIKSKGRKQSLQQRVTIKQDKERARQLEQRLRDERIREARGKAARREENARRREANARRAETVQLLKNQTTNVKKMKRKQLRMVAKRDVLGMNVQM